MIEIIIGIAAGGILPIQTALGAKLRKVLKSPLRGALANFLVASVFLALILTCSGHGLLIDSTLLHTQPWWIWIGGLAGVVYMTGNIILFPRLGSVQTVIMPVLGQIVMSMLIDAFGWFGLPQVGFGWKRAAAALIVIAGISTAVYADADTRHKNIPCAPDVVKSADTMPSCTSMGREKSYASDGRDLSSAKLRTHDENNASHTRNRGESVIAIGKTDNALTDEGKSLGDDDGDDKNSEPKHRLPVIAWQLLAIMFGMFSSVQTAVNGHLSRLLHSPIHAAFVSFVVGTVALLILTLIFDGSLGIRDGRITNTVIKQPWWIWTCGLFGAVFVLGNAFLAALLGTGLTVSVVLFGQIACSTLIEQFGWLDAQRRRATAVRFIGLLMLFAGVLLIKLA
jgi:transporter family-2 protein